MSTAASPAHSLMELLQLLRPPLDDLKQVHRLELSMPQFATLLLLREAGTLTISDIAVHIGLSRAAASHLVERLVQRQMLDRAEDRTDRRHKRVTLTATSRRLIDEIEATHRRLVDKLWSSVPESERSAAEGHITALLALFRNAESVPEHIQNRRVN